MCIKGLDLIRAQLSTESRRGSSRLTHVKGGQLSIAQPLQLPDQFDGFLTEHHQTESPHTNPSPYRR